MTETHTQVIERIRRAWFKHHQATLEMHGPVTIIHFKEPKSAHYAVQYILIGNKLIVTGDIGDAVFRLTWPATLESFKNLQIDYFLEKLTAHSGDRWLFDTKTARTEFTEWMHGYTFTDESDIADQQRLIRDIHDIMDSSDNQSEYLHRVYEYASTESYSYFDSEDFSIIADFGKTIPARLYAYLEGLKMASEQLGN